MSKSYGFFSLSCLNMDFMCLNDWNIIFNGFLGYAYVVPNHIQTILHFKPSEADRYIRSCTKSNKFLYVRRNFSFARVGIFCTRVSSILDFLI